MGIIGGKFVTAIPQKLTLTAILGIAAYLFGEPDVVIYALVGIMGIYCYRSLARCYFRQKP